MVEIVVSVVAAENAAATRQAIGAIAVRNSAAIKIKKRGRKVEKIVCVVCEGFLSRITFLMWATLFGRME